MYLAGSEPGDLDMYETHDHRHGNITVFVKDHRGETIKEVVRLYNEFVSENHTDLGRLEIAGGVIGTLAAANEQIGTYEALLLSLTLLAIVIFCSISFRSVLAGVLLLIPLAIANYFVFAYMGLKEIGLNISTLPVATIAIGIGVDYGIYLYSRLREEYKRVQDLYEAFVIALVTTCKAITFTALTVAVGVVFWSFSSIKFQAEMGLLLTIVTFFHLLGTLILLPALVLVIKPKFITEIKK
jgi:predicted RND superfamily exporter protein